MPLVSDGENREFDQIVGAAAAAPGGVPNISRALGHELQLLLRMQEYNRELRDLTCLSVDETETVILTVSRWSGNRYAFGRHIPIARNCGMTDDQICEIASGEQSTSFVRLTPRQECLAVLAKEVTVHHGLTDATFERFAEHFPATNLPAVLQLAGFYVLMAIVQRGIGAPLESEFVANLESFWPARP